MSGIELTDAEREELGPWNSRLLESTVQRIVATRTRAAVNGALAPVEALTSGTGRRQWSPYHAEQLRTAIEQGRAAGGAS